MLHPRTRRALQHAAAHAPRGRGRAVGLAPPAALHPHRGVCSARAPTSRRRCSCLEVALTQDSPSAAALEGRVRRAFSPSLRDFFVPPKSASSSVARYLAGCGWHIVLHNRNFRSLEALKNHLYVMCAATGSRSAWSRRRSHPSPCRADTDAAPAERPTREWHAPHQGLV